MIGMGFLDWLIPPKLEPQEKFAQQWSASDPAFAAWWFGDHNDSETVTPQTVLGLSAVIRSIQVISTTIADLPLKTYERGEDGSKVRSESVFDDPWPGVDGMTPFAWVETVLIHQILHRATILWHEDIASDGTVRAYRPMDPTLFTIKRVNGKRRFEFIDAATREKREVGSEQITYIAGPSLDGDAGIPLLGPAKAVFSAAISGDKTAQTVLRRGIRLAGLVTPGDEHEDFDSTEGAAILEQLRNQVVGRENAGDIALINRRLKLQNWQPNNIEAQWAETKQLNLGDHERLFGMPPHLLADTERQTSWGTGVSEQNLGLARYTLKGYTSRLEQALSRKLPRGQFVEFDYKGLLQGTPAQEIELLIKQVEAGILTPDEARSVLNLPPLTPAQKAELAPPAPPRPTPLPISDRQEATA